MSKVGQGEGAPSTNVDQIHDNSGIERKKGIDRPTLRTIAKQPAEDINAKERIKNEGLYTEPAVSLQGVPQSKSSEMVAPGDEEAPESDRARIERLGRERPAKFKSFGAELAFCYSVIASQFMAVRFVAATPSKADS